MAELAFEPTQRLQKKSMLLTTWMCSDWEAFKFSGFRIVTLGILLLGKLQVEICTVYTNVVIIVKLTISQLKLESSEFDSAVSKKTAFNLSFESL